MCDPAAAARRRRCRAEGAGREHHQQVRPLDRVAVGRRIAHGEEDVRAHDCECRQRQHGERSGPAREREQAEREDPREGEQGRNEAHHRLPRALGDDGPGREQRRGSGWRRAVPGQRPVAPPVRVEMRDELVAREGRDGMLQRVERVQAEIEPSRPAMKDRSRWRSAIEGERASVCDSWLTSPGRGRASDVATSMRR